MPGRTPLVVETEIVHAINDETLAGFSVALAGTAPAETETTRNAAGTLVHVARFAPLAAEGGASERPVTLALKVAHKVDLTGQGDPRTLAVALRKIVVRAA